MTEPPEVPERGRRSGRLLDGLRDRLRGWHLGLVVGVVVAVLVAGYLWLSGGDSTSQTAEAPQVEDAELGVACPHLHEAFIHNQAGDAEALRRSVEAAARAGEQALQQSGRAFGRPEMIAIELQYALTEQPDTAREDTARYLAQAQETCEPLGRWVEKR